MPAQQLCWEQGELPPTFLTLACSALESFSAFLASFSSCLAVNCGESGGLEQDMAAQNQGPREEWSLSRLPLPAVLAMTVQILWPQRDQCPP